MHKNRSKGFTLIELLVVVAIIGILSAVVLASLSTARDKAKDASVQESMSGMRTAAEIAYTTLGNKYSSGAVSTCDTATAGQIFSDTGSNMKGLLTAVITASGAGNVACFIKADGSAWAVSAKLPSNPATNPYFCVDSTGAAKAQAAAATASNC